MSFAHPRQELRVRVTEEQAGDTDFYFLTFVPFFDFFLLLGVLMGLDTTEALPAPPELFFVLLFGASFVAF